jgi:predicted ATPase
LSAAHVTRRSASAPCATIDWSFGLLGDKERSAFTAMAVFAAGAAVGAAETVAGASLERLSRPAFLGVGVDKHARECVAGAAGARRRSPSSLTAWIAVASVSRPSLGSGWP